MSKQLVNVKPVSIKVLLWAVAAFILVDTLAKFGIIDFTSYISPIFIPVVASLFIFFEIGLIQVLKRKSKLDAIQAFGLVIAILGLVAVLLSIIGLNLMELRVIQGVVNIALGIYVLIEIFKK